MLNRSLRPVIAFVFLASTNPTWAYQSNDWGYQPSRMTDIPYNQNFNFQNKLQLNLDFLTRNIAPALDFNISSLRLPTFEIPDFGNQSWTFQKTNFSFLDDKRLSGLSGSFSLPNQNQISFDLKNFSYQSKLSAPQGFTQTFRDIQGQTLTKTRINQTSVPNPSFDNHRAYLQKNHPNLVSNTNAPYPAGLRPPPTKELVKEFQETWVMKSGEGRKEFKLNVAISDHDQNRWPKTFEGTVQRESGTIKFTASVPRDEYGRVKSAHITIEGKGTPKAEIRWNPKSTDTPDYEKGLKLLSENLPIPFLAGPRSATRINGADIPESPVRVNDSGLLKKDQLASDRNLANLVGREELGISVGFSPSGAGSKAGFSLGNALRNLGYMITGRWSEVKSMRQELNGMQKQEPGKFVLSAGFNDPGFMGGGDLRTALENSKRIYVPPSKLESTKVGQSNTLVQADGPTARTGFFTRTLEVLTTPVGVAFKAAAEVVKTGLSIVFGGNLKQERLKGYDLISSPIEQSGLVGVGKGKMDFYLKKESDPQNFPPSAVFEIRNDLKTPPLLNVLPHSSFVSLAKDVKASDTDVYFNKAPTEFIEKLKMSESIDLYFHGYNVGTNKSLNIQEKFSKLLDEQGYQNINALVTWSGDVGNNFLAKMFYFNRSVKSASLSWEGVASTADFIRTYNPNVKINAATHSLGAGMLLEAASRGVKFGTVILIVPAVDNEALSPGGKYEKALLNIDQLVVVYSRNQKAVFIPYMLGRFDRALGDVGPSGPVRHSNFAVIDATKISRNPEYGIRIQGHGDIYGDKMIEMMIRYFHSARY